MALKLLIYIDGNETAVFDADCAPRVGELVRFVKADHEYGVEVKSIEHEFVQLSAGGSSQHIVHLSCEIS